MEKLLQKRVVLLISEDVEGARYLYQCLKGNCSDPEPELYFSSHHEKLENKGHFEGGRLIIATNIAGRGNVRVELQAYGRAARSGDPGSCKMIFYDKDGDFNYAVCKRDLSEAHRVELDYL